MYHTYIVLHLQIDSMITSHSERTDKERAQILFFCVISLLRHINYGNYGAGDRSIAERGQESHVPFSYFDCQVFFGGLDLALAHKAKA